MQQIRRYIDRRTAELRDGPFVTWLADESVPARERLTRWLPCAAPWVFGFMDLNGVLLRYPDAEARREPFKRAINDHLAEDAQHWMLYIEDLRRLGLDAPVALPDTLAFLWGDETRCQRLAVYRLTVLAARAQDPLVRYCLVAALESFAHLLFQALQRVAAPFGREAGVEPLYVGAVHADKEPGYLTNQSDAVEATMQTLVLDDTRRREGLEIVAEVCDLVEDRWGELHRCGRSNGHRAFLRTA